MKSPTGISFNLNVREYDIRNQIIFLYYLRNVYLRTSDQQVTPAFVYRIFLERWRGGKIKNICRKMNISRGRVHKMLEQFQINAMYSMNIHFPISKNSTVNYDLGKRKIERGYGSTRGYKKKPFIMGGFESYTLEKQ